MKPLVERRMRESKKRVLVDDWDEDEVRRRFGDVLRAINSLDRRFRNAPILYTDEAPETNCIRYHHF